MSKHAIKQCACLWAIVNEDTYCRQLGASLNLLNNSCSIYIIINAAPCGHDH